MKTKEAVLSEVTGIPEYRINKEGGEYITKAGALQAMEEYASQFKQPPVSDSMPSDMDAANEAKRYANEMNKVGEHNAFHEIDFYNGTAWLRRKILETTTA